MICWLTLAYSPLWISYGPTLEFLGYTSFCIFIALYFDVKTKTNDFAHFSCLSVFLQKY